MVQGNVVSKGTASVRNISAIGIFFLASVTAASAAPAQDVSGIWWANSYSMQIRPSDGSALPFTPAGAEAYRKNVAGLKDGRVVDAARKVCVPDGIPRILATPYP